MSDPHNVDVVPWPTARTDRAPSDCVFVCSFENNVGVDDIEEVALFRRTKQHDELWLLNEFAQWLAATHASQDDIATAAITLLGAVFRSRVGFSWPRAFVRSGLIGLAQYEELLAKGTAKLDANREAAMKTRGAIVEAADRLGLGPSATGTDPRAWRAQCPGTNHFLLLDSNTEKFFCGWCRRGGGADELAVFVAERRKSGSGTASRRTAGAARAV
jgi:hypothetical protein